jgi:hypothetical protein
VPARSRVFVRSDAALPYTRGRRDLGRVDLDEAHTQAVAKRDRVAVADVVDAVDGWSSDRARCGQPER